MESTKGSVCGSAKEKLSQSLRKEDTHQIQKNLKVTHQLLIVVAYQTGTHAISADRQTFVAYLG
jgi:hypothetical protein